MTTVDTTPDRFNAAELLDWRQAKVLDRRSPCGSCGGLTLLRHPTTGRPMHKVCAERERAADNRHAAAAYHAERG